MRQALIALSLLFAAAGLPGCAGDDKPKPPAPDAPKPPGVPPGGP